MRGRAFLRAGMLRTPKDRADPPLRPDPRSAPSARAEGPPEDRPERAAEGPVLPGGPSGGGACLCKTHLQARGGAFWRRERKEAAAWREVSLQVPRDQMVADLGRSGAGNSTSVKLLTGSRQPTARQRSGLGMQPYRNRLRLLRRVGLLFGQRSQLWWDLPPRDSFGAVRRIYGLADERYPRNLADFSDVLGLGDLLRVPVRQLSLDQRMRAELVAAPFDPEVVFLDEPASGLDVQAKGRCGHERHPRVPQAGPGARAAHGRAAGTPSPNPESSC